MDNVIVGVDPGTTTGYAVFNLTTGTFYTSSKRHLGMNELIREIIKHGHVLAIACDKKPCPRFVEKLSSKLNSKLIVPEIELKEEDKRELTKGLNYNNLHERDSIAAIVYSLKRLKPLLTKIERIEKDKMMNKEFKNALTRLVFSGKSVKEAYEILEKINFEKNKIEEKFCFEKQKDEKKDDGISKISKENTLYKFNKILKENEILKRQNKNLLKKISELKRYNEFLMRKIMSKEKNDKTKEEKIKIPHEELKQNLLSVYDNLNEKINNLESKIKELQNIILNSKDFVVIKKLRNFLTEEFESKNKTLKIVEGDVLLVENPNEYSESTINKLKEKVSIVFYKNEISKKTEEKLPFVFLNIKNLIIYETDIFAIIKKEDFEAQKKKKDFLNEIIKNYKLKKI